VPLVLFVYFR